MNAAKKAVGMCAILLIGGSVCAANLSNKVLTVDIQSGSREYDPDELAAITSAGTVTNIVKTGHGTLLSKGISSYSGTITVRDGILKITSDGAGLGASSTRTIVENGATLWREGGNYSAWTIVLSGNGYSSDASVTNGALRSEGGGTFVQLEIVDDALINTTGGRVYLGGSWNGSLKMGGNTLTLKGNDVYWGFKPAQVQDPGDLVVDLSGGSPYLTPQVDMNWGADHQIRIDRGGMNLSGYAYIGDMKIVCAAESSAFYCPDGGRWNGPIELRAGTATLSNNGGKSFVFGGSITGSGKLNVVNDPTSQVAFLATNTFADVVSVRGGDVLLEYCESVPKTIMESFAFSETVRLALRARTAGAPYGWTMEQFMTAWNSVKDVSAVSAICLDVAEGETFRSSYAFGEYDMSQKPFGAMGDGEVIFDGDFGNRVNFTLYSPGNLVFENPAANPDRVNAFGKILLQRGDLRMRNCGTVSYTSCDVGSRDGSRSTLYLENTFVASDAFGAGSVGEGARGELRIDGGSAVTNRMTLGAAGVSSEGSVYVHDGTLRLDGSSGGYLGRTGVGFVEVGANGRCELANLEYFGYDASGVGILRLNGGEMTVENNVLYIGCSGTGVLYQTSGELQFKRLYMGDTPGTENPGGPLAVATFTGSDTLATAANFVYLGNRSDATVILNVNDGAVLATPSITRKGGSRAAYVNVNGGVLKATARADFFGRNEERPDAVTIYSAGAVIDVGANQVASYVPLTKPVGGGLVSVGLPAGCAEQFPDCPVVTVSGDGFGASAVANYDSATHTLKGVDVTSPGQGYNPSKLTVTLDRGGSANPVTLTASVAEDSGTGSLTVKGEGGKLILYAPSTYGGQTIVDGATLWAGCEGAIPANADIVLRGGGTVDFYNFTASVARVTYGAGGGSFANAGKASIPNTFTISLAVDDLVGARGVVLNSNVSLDGSAIEISGDIGALDPNRSYSIARTSGIFSGMPSFTPSASELPKGWKYVVTGKEIRLTPIKGMVLIFR